MASTVVDLLREARDKDEQLLPNYVIVTELKEVGYENAYLTRQVNAEREHADFVASLNHATHRP
jgi:hypothetical protein